MRTRRHFLRTVLLGSAAAGAACARPARRADHPRAPRRLAGDAVEVCHGVRDGSPLPTVPVSARHDVVIVGGGPSGLCAAHRLRDLDLLLLEKEDACGGNCLPDEWQGVRLSTGGAFYTESETELVELLDELAARGRPVQGGDALVVEGRAVTDFFRAGADRLPFPRGVRDDFKRSREDLLKLLRSRPARELDRRSFAELLAPYDPLLTRFWDRFGMSNWGGAAAETSGFIGAEAYTWAGGAEDPRWTFPGGLSGAARALSTRLAAQLPGRLRTGCAVYRIERQPKGPGAIVRFLEQGRPLAVAARAVIVALPKFFAAHVVDGLPAAQLAAMRAFRYEPFPVFNVCLNRPGPEPSYDNWLLDTPFTDFIPADWVLYAGKGPRQRKTALTVYHPLPRERRPELLVDPLVLEMADAVADALERHFPGTLETIEEIRVHRRGHPMFVAAPGRMDLVEQASAPSGPVLFANADSEATVSSFYGALLAATRAAEQARARLAA